MRISQWLAVVLLYGAFGGVLCGQSYPQLHTRNIDGVLSNGSGDTIEFSGVFGWNLISWDGVDYRAAVYGSVSFTATNPAHGVNVSLGGRSLGWTGGGGETKQAPTSDVTVGDYVIIVSASHAGFNTAEFEIELCPEGGCIEEFVVTPAEYFFDAWEEDSVVLSFSGNGTEVPSWNGPFSWWSSYSAPTVSGASVTVAAREGEGQGFDQNLVFSLNDGRQATVRLVRDAAQNECRQFPYNYLNGRGYSVRVFVSYKDRVMRSHLVPAFGSVFDTIEICDKPDEFGAGVYVGTKADFVNRTEGRSPGNSEGDWDWENDDIVLTQVDGGVLFDEYSSSSFGKDYEPPGYEPDPSNPPVTYEGDKKGKGLTPYDETDLAAIWERSDLTEKEKESRERYELWGAGEDKADERHLQLMQELQEQTDNLKLQTLDGDMQIELLEEISEKMEPDERQESMWEFFKGLFERTEDENLVTEKRGDLQAQVNAGANSVEGVWEGEAPSGSGKWTVAEGGGTWPSVEFPVVGTITLSPYEHIPFLGTLASWCREVILILLVVAFVRLASAEVDNWYRAAVQVPQAGVNVGAENLVGGNFIKQASTVVVFLGVFVALFAALVLVLNTSIGGIGAAIGVTSVADAAAGTVAAAAGPYGLPVWGLVTDFIPVWAVVSVAAMLAVFRWQIWVVVAAAMMVLKLFRI